MDKLTLWEKVKEYIGHLAWKVYLWAYYSGNEDRYNNERDVSSFQYWEVELPKKLIDKLHPPLPDDNINPPQP